MMKLTKMKTYQNPPSQQKGGQGWRSRLAEILVVSAINVSYRTKTTAVKLVGMIRDDDDTSPQLRVFFQEVVVEDQLEFAARYGITEDQLIQRAKRYEQKTGRATHLLDPDGRMFPDILT